jgi:regulator of sigma E protease
MVEAIQASQGRPVRVELERKGEMVQVSIKPAAVTVKDIFGDEVKTFQVGIQASREVVSYEVGPWEAVGMALERTYAAGELIATSVYKLASREVPLDSVGGPILIAQAAGEAAKHGAASFLSLAGLISINLAILNLLPIPALDGGHLFFFLVEAVRRKPLSIAAREKATQVGMALLLLLMVVIFYNDIARIVTGETP